MSFSTNPIDISDTISFQSFCKIAEIIKKALPKKKELTFIKYYESFKKHRDKFRLEKGLTDNDKEVSNELIKENRIYQTFKIRI